MENEKRIMDIHDNLSKVLKVFLEKYPFQTDTPRVAIKNKSNSSNKTTPLHGARFTSGKKAGIKNKGNKGNRIEIIE
jgi:hypothetical protein